VGARGWQGTSALRGLAGHPKAGRKRVLTVVLPAPRRKVGSALRCPNRRAAAAQPSPERHTGRAWHRQPSGMAGWLPGPPSHPRRGVRGSWQGRACPPRRGTVWHLRGKDRLRGKTQLWHWCRRTGNGLVLTARVPPSSLTLAPPRVGDDGQAGGWDVPCTSLGGFIAGRKPVRSREAIKWAARSLRPRARSSLLAPGTAPRQPGCSSGGEAPCQDTRSARCHPRARPRATGTLQGHHGCCHPAGTHRVGHPGLCASPVRPSAILLLPYHYPGLTQCHLWCSPSTG